MQQAYWIKSSQSWTCPKAGAWKIVCVGGGASGGVTFHANVSALQSAGGTTSFGSLLSAPGGAVEACCPTGGTKSCGGYGGYDGMNYGGTPMIAQRITTSENTTAFLSPASGNGGVLGSPGLGYGAGGGVGEVWQISVKNSSNNIVKATASAVPGKCGGMAAGIYDLALNQSVSCTVGTSAKPTINASTLIQQYQKCGSSITEIADAAAAQVAAAVAAGTAGVIYIEFLG